MTRRFVGVDDLDRAAPVVRDERDVRPVGRPDRVRIVGRLRGQWLDRARSDVDGYELVLGAHDDDSRQGPWQLRPPRSREGDGEGRRRDQGGEKDEAQDATIAVRRTGPAVHAGAGRSGPVRDGGRVEGPDALTGVRPHGISEPSFEGLGAALLSHGQAPCAAA